MEKAEHARLLREAMSEKGLRARDIGDAVGASTRTVGNWISRTKPTMPNAVDQAALRKLLGDYTAGGAVDQVERALRRSELIDYRQNLVLAEYQKQLHLQRAEQAG